MNEPAIDLYIRRDELQIEHDTLSDRLDACHLTITQTAEALQTAKTNYTIEPANDLLASRLKTATSDHDSACKQFDELEQQRKDIGFAVDAIQTRIRTQEAHIAQQAKTALQANLPEKLSALADDLVNAMARYQAAAALNGMRSEPALAIGRLINGNRAVYLAGIETAKAELKAELS